MKPVFRKLGYWDEKNKMPFEDKTVTFEQYLELVCGSVINEGKKAVLGSFEGSILKRNGTFSGEAIDSHRAKVEEQSSEPSSPIRDTENLKFRFPDNPTEEELETEWQQFLENENRKHKHHDHADEGAAFKQVKAAEKETGGAARDEAHAFTTDTGEAEPDVKQEDVPAAAAQNDCEDSPAAQEPVDPILSSEASDGLRGVSDEQSTSATADVVGESVEKEAAKEGGEDNGKSGRSFKFCSMPGRADASEL